MRTSRVAFLFGVLLYPELSRGLGRAFKLDITELVYLGVRILCQSDDRTNVSILPYNFTSARLKAMVRGHVSRYHENTS